MIHAAPNTEGTPQMITFPGIPDQAAGTTTLKLAATSDAGLPVSYYVREGPAEIEGDSLHFTRVPPCARLPLQVTVVAWQFGRSIEPHIQTAVPVEHTFRLLRTP